MTKNRFPNSHNETAAIGTPSSNSSGHDFIVHYNRAEPFRSITNASPTELLHILNALSEENTWGIARFSDQQYLMQRREVEKELRERFIKIGGRPALKNPIYFFLGSNLAFEGHKKNIGYKILLRDLDPHSISFSYGDSMFCFHEGNRIQAGEKYQSPLCQNLYSLENLPQLLSHPDFPKVGALPIEAHLWAEVGTRVVEQV